MVRIHDFTITNSTIINGLEEGERIVADTRYIGDERFCTPIRKPQNRELNEDEMHWNQFHSAIHFIHIERNKRIKIFSFARQKWRHSLRLHQRAITAICKMINIRFNFNPLNKINFPTSPIHCGFESGKLRKLNFTGLPCIEEIVWAILFIKILTISHFIILILIVHVKGSELLIY